MIRQSVRTEAAHGGEALPVRPLRCLLAIDDVFGQHLLADSLTRSEGTAIVGMSDDVRQMPQDVATLRPDVVFIEARLFDRCSRVPSWDRTTHPCQLVVVSSVASDASHAFVSGAADFLHRPYSRARVAEVLVRVRARAEEQALVAWAQAAMGAAVASGPQASEPARRTVFDVPSAQTLMIASNGHVEFVLMHTIESVVTSGRSVLIRTPKQTFPTSTPLLEIERRLDPEWFVRVHRSAVVNIASVRRLRAEAGGGSVVLRSGSTLAVAKRRLSAVRRALVCTQAIPGSGSDRGIGVSGHPGPQFEGQGMRPRVDIGGACE